MFRDNLLYKSEPYTVIWEKIVRLDINLSLSFHTKVKISSFGKKIIVAFINDECPPILCRRINYLEDKQYQGKFDDNPLQKTGLHNYIIRCSHIPHNPQSIQ